MNDSIRALLENSVDYAGIYPPASLDLETSVRNFADYCQSAESWMLGRFVCPVGRLDEFALHLAQLPAAGCSLTAIGSASPSLKENQLRLDLEKMAAFATTYSQVQFGSIEFKLPPVNDSESSALTEFFEESRDAARVIDGDAGEFRMFAETPVNRVELVAEHLSEAHRQTIGLKLRTGGVGIDISPNQIADFIAPCVSNNIFFKATAGLHHPLSHQDDDHWECGYLNLFVACVLAKQHALNTEQISELLAVETIGSFTFESESIRWKEFEIDHREIFDARNRGIVSFGSCSFDEPRSGLRLLGFI